MTDETSAPAEQPADGGDATQKQAEPTFTQAEVDKIVRERAERLYRKRVGDVDIDDLKAKASEKQTAEERLAELETKYAAAEARSLRAEIANAHGISAEDRDLFLTGTDEETLTAQAKRLAERASESKKQGNYVPNIGKNPQPPADDSRSFLRHLTGRD